MNRNLTRRAPAAAAPAALALFVLLLLPAPGRTESLLDKESLATFGGTYLSDCGNLESARVEVTERTITYIHRDLRIVSSNLRPAPQLHGTQMPAHFRGAILSDTEQGEVRALLFEDTGGAWIELRGENPDLGALADPATTIRFLRCNEADLAERSASGQVTGAQAMLQDPAFKNAYKKALGSKKRDAWITTLEGPATPRKTTVVDEIEYQVLGACKTDACASKNLVLLYSPAKKVVYGKIYQAGTSTLIGSPPAAVALQLESLWKAQWRP
jgi:hypothetical protein